MAASTSSSPAHSRTARAPSRATATPSPARSTAASAKRAPSSGDRLLQAKGRHYRLADLLAAQPWASRFEGGSFATIYLAPFNYHRVHMPLRGELRETVYVPGRLFSVNGVTAQHVPGLFARNERVLTLFDTAFGQFALVLVGALNVGSMATVWAGDITPAARRVVTRLPAPPTTLDKGAELGRFNMGSTVILLVRAESRALALRSACRPRGAAGPIPGQRGMSDSPPAASAAWRPTATLDALRRRAGMLAAAREFFAGRGVLEVETPHSERRRRERSANRIVGRPQVAGMRGTGSTCAPRLNTP